MSLKKLLNFDIFKKEPAEKNSTALTYNDLINAESVYGRTLFGPIPTGHQREFFKYKDNVWIWYENWLDEAGLMQCTTIRYEVRPDGVFKKVSGGERKKIQGDELKNFVTAAKTYFDLVKEKLYS